MSTAEQLPTSSRSTTPAARTGDAAAPSLAQYLSFTHGGHAVTEGAHGAAAPAALRSATTVRDADAADEVTTPFAYLFPDIAEDPASHLPADDPAATVAALDALGAAMALQDSAPDGDNPSIPPVYTYWGQFIDHDMTANTDRDKDTNDITKPVLTPLPPGHVTQSVVNLRRGTLDLDSVYGDGPGKTPGFYEDDGVKLRVGRVTVEGDEGANIPPGGERVPPDGDLARDLPRIGPLLDAGVISEADLPADVVADPDFRRRALIGDGRNDENLIVAQFHTAFLRFHNAAVDWLAANVPGDGNGKPASFERARDLTRRHYQWLVVNDFLKTVAMPSVVDEVMSYGPRHYGPRDGKLFMPLEFSVACYRFGHSLVRAFYDYNRNFGVGPSPFIPGGTPFNLLFLFTGKGSPPFANQGPTLPFTWVIEWDRFTDKNPVPPAQDPKVPRLARKIDTHITPPLTLMENEVKNDPRDEAIKGLLKHLARRNLRRGYLLSIPTGQSVARKLGVAPLSEAELRQGGDVAVNTALDQGGFIERTPLWYYVLKEAEVRAGGASLGEVGSRVVCETIIGLLRHDKNSYLNVRGGWNPSKGVTLPDGGEIRTIRHFLRFAGVAA